MPVPPPPPPITVTVAQPLRQRFSNTSLRAFASGTASAVGTSLKNRVRGRRLSTSTPLLRGTPFLHRRPWFPLSPRTSRLYSTANSGAHSGATGSGSGSGSSGSKGTGGKRAGFGQRLRQALSKTKVEWYPIPIGLGIGFLAFSQFRKAVRNPIGDEDHVVAVEESDTLGQKSKPIRPDGPWQVQVLSTLPFKAFSRAWGWFNSRPLPVFLRTPGFKLYSYIFGVNLDEIANPDLTSYRNLSEFFYRELRPGTRPIDPHPNALVSPADGTVLHFGEVRPGGHVEQVKGMTYPLDALIGSKSVGHEFPTPSASSRPPSPGTKTPPELSKPGILTPDEEFAIVNGIHYTLPSLLHGTCSDSEPPHPPPQCESDLVNQLTHLPLQIAPIEQPPPDDLHPSASTKLFFCVIYLAPGDYHRYHSPVNWVVQFRRHFSGELFSVSPFLQRHLPNLFTLNERVALLGKWKHGLFTMTPVGATNVGSIIVNFDKELRTNHAWGELARPGAVKEASYASASKVLGGWPVRKGEEIGGFKLGSTVVLVFEAPGGESAEEGGFQWECRRGGKVKVGERLGVVA
ncbi:phosphatidylserine decarboxylase-domain-containing protein [Tirmania nivea]|nr:phosphatidylserine decarboxylase-domain-containing protein [Tirmania nivea]